MSLKLGTTNIAGLSERTKYNANSLLDFKWTDHILNEVSWLRADTFSWQSGLVYVAAYNALVADIAGATSTTETIAGTEITYYRTSTGRKVCLPAQEANVLTVYNATGYGWYYILDTTNTRFKLPRNKWGFTGLRTDVGDYIEAGLPNVTGDFYPISQRLTITGTPQTKSGAFNGSTLATANKTTPNNGSDVAEGSKINFDASLSNSIYGNSPTVQPPAVQMYLYFYVGDFSQTAIEQTAGLNSTLFNGKADVNLTNVNNIGTSLSASWAMPSDTYDTLTLGSNGSQYIAPANGYFSIGGNDTETGVFRYVLRNNVTRFGVSSCTSVSTTSGWLAGILPVRKGDTVTVYYNGFTSAGVLFLFYYAQGSESEA